MDDYELETSDEAYNCPGEERQIAFSYLCDEFPDCNDGSDEDPEVCAGKLLQCQFEAPQTTWLMQFFFFVCYDLQI